MSDDRPENLSAGEALERLEAGNERFVSDNPIRPNSNAAQAAATPTMAHAAQGWCHLLMTGQALTQPRIVSP